MKSKKNRYLKELRANKGLNQGEMAKEIGMSRATYGDKENGKGDFTVREIKIIASRFELQISDVNRIFFSDITT